MKYISENDHHDQKYCQSRHLLTMITHNCAICASCNYRHAILLYIQCPCSSSCNSIIMTTKDQFVFRVYFRGAGKQSPAKNPLML